MCMAFHHAVNHSSYELIPATVVTGNTNVVIIAFSVGVFLAFCDILRLKSKVEDHII